MTAEPESRPGASVIHRADEAGATVRSSRSALRAPRAPSSATCDLVVPRDVARDKVDLHAAGIVDLCTAGTVDLGATGIPGLVAGRAADASAAPSPSGPPIVPASDPAG